MSDPRQALFLIHLPAALCLPAALVGARFGALAGCAGGLACAGVYAFIGMILAPGGLEASPAAAAAIMATTGGAVGKLASRQRARGIQEARATWTHLRQGQISEFLSYVLYQLRENQISVTSLVESLSLSAPKDDDAFTERLGRLRRVVGELNGKAARLLGENSPITTQAGRPVAFSVAELAQESARLAQAAFAGADVAISVVEDGPQEPVTCDRRALSLSLLAVLQNSLEACALRGQGSISMVVRRHKDHAEIELLDDGGGIAADTATLFEPFYAARSGSPGMGLGLPMARRMLERLGGTVRVKTKNGCTAVLLEFPAKRDLPFVRNEESTWAGRRHGI